MSILTKNIGERPYTGKRNVKGKLRVSNEKFLNIFFNGAATHEQVLDVKQGNIYEVVE